MVVAAWALLAESPRPTEDEVREAISGNLCRCTGYAKIVSAIRAAAERAAGLPPPSPPRGPAPVAARGSEDFHTPATLAEALEIRARHPGCVVLAGGTDLMVAGIPSRRPVLALEAIAELVVLREGAGGLEIGAATRVELLARDPLVARLAPGLAEAARQLGARGIRERATMGGNLANASPAADLAPPLCAAGATLRLAARDRRREVPIAAFYRGYKDCDLAPDELLIGVALPPLAPGAREGFRKLGTRRAQSIAKISVAARVTVTAGRIAEIGLAAGSVAPTVVRLVRTEAALRGERPGSDLPERAGNLAAAEVAPIDDVRSTADYRRAMVGVLVADLLRALATE
jgi:CO/xanthine dehydrogenase FAD-binding subunit